MKKPSKQRQFPHKIDVREAKFIDAYMLHGNGTQAVIDAGYNVKTRASANSYAPTLLAKPSLREKILERTLKQAQIANKRIFQLVKGARSEYVALEASKDILDRAGFKAIEKFQNTNVVVQLSGTLAKKREIAGSDVAEETKTS